MKRNFYKNGIFIFGSIFAIFIIYIFVILYEVWPIESKTMAQAGVFGDSFGVLTALFSALAFGGLMLTIWQQQEEIEFNRNEIKAQNFENSFFRMLETHNILVSGIDIRNPESGQIYDTGRDCFCSFYEELTILYNIQADAPLNEEEKLRLAYEEFWKKWRKDLAHYFRYLYNVLKHIDRAEISNKKEYTNIVRAQLSEYELLIIFYNCIYVHGKEKFKPLVERYSLFNNLPTDLLLAESHNLYYSNSAY